MTTSIDNPLLDAGVSTAAVKCAVCDVTARPKLVLRNVKNGWHLLRCTACELTFAHPQPSPEQISAHYNGLYADLATGYDEVKMEGTRRSVAGYLSAITNHARFAKPRFLDLGGGLGYYTKAFSDAGIDATMVEQDPVSLRFARDVLKLPRIIESNAEDFFRDNQEKFDIVFFRHVIEHVTRPNDVIAGIANLLSAGGLLIIETDNNAGVELLLRPGPAKFYLQLYKAAYAPVSYFSLLRRRPFALDPPRHLFGFRMNNLSLLLEKNGLKPVAKICYRLGHPVYWGNMPLPSLRSMTRNLREGRIKRVAIDGTEWLLTPLRFLLERFGMASGICIYAVKRPADGVI